MKQTLIALSLLLAAVVPAKSFAAYDATKATSCIVYIQKIADITDQPNWAIMCDGYQVQKSYFDLSALSNTKPLEAALRSTLSTTMAADSSVVCTEADNQEVWYYNCYRQAAFTN